MTHRPLTYVAALAALAAAISALPSHAQTLKGAAQAVDGRTLQLPAGRVQLHGIDAPDLGQICFGDRGQWGCGLEARQALADLLRGGMTECAIVTKGSPGNPPTAICATAGANLASAMVAKGFAMNWPAVGKGSYRQEHESARRLKRGMWASSFDLPHEWRRLHRANRN